MCNFCDLYETSKKFAKETTPNGINVYFKICLREIRIQNRIRRGTYTHRPMDLKYCPECGKKLKGTKVIRNEVPQQESND